MDQRQVLAGGDPGQVPRAVGIDGLAEILLAFGQIHIGIGSTIDEGADLFLVHQLRDCAGIQDIKGPDRAFCADIRKDEFRSSGRKQLQFCTELSEGPRDQYFLHCKNFVQR